MENEVLLFIMSQFAEVGILAAAVVAVGQIIKSVLKLKDKVLFSIAGFEISKMYVVALLLSAAAGGIGYLTRWGIYEDAATIWHVVKLTAQVFIAATFGWDHIKSIQKQFKD
jgi:hypothetical protein